MTRWSARKLSISWASTVVVVACAIAGRVAVCRAEDQKAEDAEVAPDLSTARSAALAWIDACWSGDARAAHKVLVDEERQREFMTGPLRFSAALRALESAAVKQFGDAGKRVTGYPDGSAKSIEKQLEIKEEGDRAAASGREAVLPLQLRRIDGRWRVDLSGAIGDARARRAAEASGAAAKVAEDMAAEVTAGKFQTADEARTVFRERRLAQVKK